MSPDEKAKVSQYLHDKGFGTAFTDTDDEVVYVADPVVISNGGGKVRVEFDTKKVRSMKEAICFVRVRT